ncbi:MAG: endonuclease/exonuclease/phosphatase family protein [Acidobacteriota bacterium]
MWAKIMLVMLFLAMIGLALHFQPARERTLLGTRAADGPRLRLMTWNIGYADLENDSRAKDKDLDAVVATILAQDPDAIALQELTGVEQLDILLAKLGNRYHGAVGRFGKTDRVEALLVKSDKANFEDIPSDDRYALAATFHFRNELPNILLVSAHAPTFQAARRRAYIEAVIDWANTRSKQALVFVAGDFNLEMKADEQTNLFTDNVKHDSEAYSYILKHFRDLGRDAGDTALNERRIDYIFGLPEAVLLRRAEVLKAAAVGRMDHWPLVVEVAL